jgi:hypothetical protein
VVTEARDLAIRSKAAPVAHLPGNTLVVVQHRNAHAGLLGAPQRQSFGDRGLLAQLLLGDRIAVHLVGTVGEAQRARAGVGAASPKSSETPPPPCTWSAQSMTWQATLGASTLIIAISFFAALLPAASIFQAALSTMRRAESIMMRASAMRSRVTPWSDTGRPKATRALARRHIFSSATSAWPMSRMQ